jgi:hypothetical protein
VFSGGKAHFSADFGTRFSITIDTEEDFEWSAEFSREGHSIASASAMADGQRFLAAAGTKPIYYADYPILSDQNVAAMLGQFMADGAADIGIHLHPWVTPPFDETVSDHNSYAGNLPEDLERAKLLAVRDLYHARLGRMPTAYRAGRYGIGPSTVSILRDAGFRCDSSLRPHFDYRADGGPDFRRESLFPTWSSAEQAHRILHIPLTAMFTGAARRLGRKIYPSASKLPVAASLLARSALIQRVPLTPEGIPAKLACAAIDEAKDMGLPLLTMSFHSPSLAPGYTPYVRDTKDLANFYQWLDTVFNHCAKRGIASASLDDILAAAN